MWGRIRKLLPVAFLAVLAVPLVAHAGQSATSPRAHVAAGPNLGPNQIPCPPKATNCCPGADCNAHPELLPASPYLVTTSVGVETISSHEIHVGQRFTVTFHAGDRSSALWSFPDIAQRVSRCKTGVDATCTYVARARDVTYPAFATYNGWSEYKWGGINKFGAGLGFGYYAIVGNGIAVSGRVADKHGNGIPQGGIQNPGGPTPDPGVGIDFSVMRHGVLTPIYAAAPGVHGSSAHPYDVGYYGLVVKPGKYIVDAGDFFEHISCGRRVVHITHDTSNLNLICKRG